MSTLRANTISNAAGTGPAALTSQWAFKATLTYDQAVPEIDESNNISSVTDSSTGVFIPNFTNNMSSAVHGLAGSSDSAAYVDILTRTASADTVRSINDTGTLIDSDQDCVAFWGDLA